MSGLDNSRLSSGSFSSVASGSSSYTRSRRELAEDQERVALKLRQLEEHEQCIRELQRSRHKKSFNLSLSLMHQPLRLRFTGKQSQVGFRLLLELIARKFEKITCGKMTALRQKRSLPPPSDLSLLHLGKVELRKVVSSEAGPQTLEWINNCESEGYSKPMQLTQQEYFVTKTQLSGNMFTDPLLPPTPKNYRSKGCKMVRLSSYKCTLWSKFDFQGVVPGILGNDFAAVVSALSPSLVLHLFQNQLFCKHGIYFCKLFRDGVWKYIILDDYVPLGSDNLIKSTINESLQIWPVLLQKAFLQTQLPDLPIETILERVTGGVVFCKQNLDEAASLHPDQIVLVRSSQQAEQIGVKRGLYHKVKEVKKGTVTVQNVFGWASRAHLRPGTSLTCDSTQFSKYFDKVLLVKLQGSLRSASRRFVLSGKRHDQFFEVEGRCVMLEVRTRAKGVKSLMEVSTLVEELFEGQTGTIWPDCKNISVKVKLAMPSPTSPSFEYYMRVWGDQELKIV